MNKVIHTVISQRRQAEKALKELEENFRTFMETTNDLMHMVDKDANIMYVNKTMAQTLGYSEKEMIGMHISEVVSKESLAVFNEKFQELIREGEIAFETVWVVKNGTEIYGEIKIVTIYDKEGHYAGSRGVLRDYTERKRTEESLRESEELHRLTLSTISDAVFITDNTGTFTYICPNVSVIFGHSYQEVKTFKYISRLLGDDLFNLNDLDRLGEVQNVERQITDKGGRIHHLLVNVKRVSIKGGAVLYTCRDVSERKRAEEMVQSERDKLQGVLNAIGDGLYIVNRDFTIEYQNEVLSNSFGQSQGRKCHSTFFKSNQPCGFCIMRKVIESCKIQGVETSFPDGRYVDIIFSPFTDVDGSPKAIVLSRDITEKKNLQAEAMFAEHLASLGELAAGVAHEINNPINGIISYAEILKGQCEERGEDDEIPTRIIKEGDRIAAIVKNLLAFARDRKEEYSPTDVQDILSDTLNLVENQITKDGINLSLDVPSNLPKIKARSQEIQQVFLNIISNARYALKQRFPGFHEYKILNIKGEIVKIESRKYIRTTFYDSGNGISANILDRICNPFFSTKPAGEGTGLGLSISHGIVKSHGGRLRFQSIEGEYTKTMVDLPVING